VQVYTQAILVSRLDTGTGRILSGGTGSCLVISNRIVTSLPDEPQYLKGKYSWPFQNQALLHVPHPIL
jgi:hypothetical protein